MSSKFPGMLRACADVWGLLHWDHRYLPLQRCEYPEVSFRRQLRVGPSRGIADLYRMISVQTDFLIISFDSIVSIIIMMKNKMMIFLCNFLSRCFDAAFGVYWEYKKNNLLRRNLFACGLALNRATLESEGYSLRDSYTQS